jgi:PAS domain S-box-containing protein
MMDHATGEKSRERPVILTIDDETSIRESFRFFLEDLGYQVFEAENGRVGLNVFEREAPDLVLVDLRMPEVDGLAVLARVTALSPNTPIIVVSGTGVISDVVEALHLGAWDYLLKPVEDFSVLQHAVDRTLERARLRRENRAYQESLEARIALRTSELKAANEELRREIQVRREAEGSLQRSERMLDSILKGVPDIIYRVDASGRISFVSDAVRRYGYRPEDLVGMDVLEVVHPDDRDRVGQGLADRRTGDRRTRDLELRLLGRESRVVPFEMRSEGVSPEPVFLVEAEGLYDSDTPTGESFLGTQGIARDISERKRTEEALRASEERFRALSENANDAIMRIDPEGKILYANPAAGRQMGLAPQALNGKTYRDLGFPEDLARDCGAAITRVFESGGPGRMEFQLPKGYWVDWSLAPEFTSDGNVEAVVISARDVTERKRAAEQLERLGMAIEQTSEIVIITDTHGSITYTNPAFERVTGHRRDEVLGQNPRILNSGVHEEQFYQALWRTISGGETWAGRFVNRKRDGSLYTEETTISPLRSAGGEIVSYVAVKRDITEELRLEADLRQALKMESVGRLAGGIAHDFNNLLSPILGYAEMLLLDFLPDDPRHEDLVEIQRAAERARDLTRQLLAFSRKQVLEMKKIDLGRVVSGFEKILRRTIREDIALEIDLASAGAVEADVSQIEQVLMNLAVNSQDAMPDGGKLTIRTADVVLDETRAADHPGVLPGAYVLLSLGDTGTGMDGDTLRNAFEPFFTTKEAGKGTGLGLATVHGIVKQHDGHIEVDSKVGLGTTFLIHFPCAEAGAKPGRAEETDDGAPRGSETVLVVEDNVAVRNLVCGMLRRYGYAVLDADGGESCLQLVENHQGPFDLLLTDVVMPNMDGRRLFERLSGILPALKVIYMSGYTDTVIGRHGVLDDGVDFIQKPISVQALTRKVREVLDR